MARWDLDRGIYPLATAVFRVNYLPFATIALAQAALQALPLAGGPVPDNPQALPFAMAGTLGASLLQAALLFFALRTLMTGERAAEQGFDGARFWSFFWRLVVLGLLPALVMLATFAQAGGLFAVLSLAVTVAVLGLFGTVLADVCAGGEGRFDAALARGRRSFRAFVGWMVLGPVLASLGLSLALAAVVAVLVALGLGGTMAGGVLEPSAWFLGLLALLGALGGAYVAALTAAALAKAWASGGGTVRPGPGA